MDSFIQKSGQLFLPSENLCIDEGICPFRGRIKHRVYMKNKPNKYGLKLYIIADVKTGYALNVEIYTGKSMTTDNSAKGIITRLCHPYFNKKHTVYMDRFYSSPLVFQFLKSNDTYAVGTVMKNRKGLSKEVIMETLNRGQACFAIKNNLLFLKWKDKRDVFMLSTKHNFDMIQINNKYRNPQMKPSCVVDYNKNKVGVDRIDRSVPLP